MAMSFSKNKWYVQRFSDLHIYFFVQDFFKNGHAKGIQVDVDLNRPRAKPKAKNSTSYSPELWKEVSASDIPEKVQQAFEEKIAP